MPKPPVDGPTARCSLAAGSRPAREHFRFLSGVVQGLDARALWDRYLFAHGAADLRRIRSVTIQLFDEVGALARRAGRPEVAVLLRRRSAPAATGAPSLTLDEFSATLPADMHSEAELLALWKEVHGEARTHRPTQRRQRLVERQLDALRWLESLAVVAPQPDDSVRAWIEAPSARRLRAVGIETLSDLQGWIALHGHHWHRHVPRVGVGGAARIVRWLIGHADSLGALPAHALQPLSQIDVRTLAPAPSAAVVPLERLRLPPALCGAQGSNRAEGPRRRIPADDDLQAVQAWLSQHPPSSHTWRAYRREAERFLLWAVFERRKALSSLDAADCSAFRDFLATPGSDWVSPRHVPRWSERWRPLEAGLSPTSRMTAIGIVRNLCGWLMRQRYLDTDPWEGVQTTRQTASPSPKSLRDGDWALLQQWLASRAPGPSADRLHALIALACHTGLRESELAAARTSWLRTATHPDGHHSWTLQVEAGPGHAAPRVVDLTDATARRLMDHLFRTQGHDSGVDRPLFAHRSDSRRALTPGRIYRLVKSALSQCADSVALRDPAAAARLRSASTQVLRHTHAGILVGEGTSLAALQHRLGHRSPASTTVYFRGSGGDCGRAPAS
jgi:site-specific recombinase XerD